jgi:peptidoglycan/LPS O-acetylase OafA/YrhL
MIIKKLEAIRGGAALYVVIHHFIGYSVLKSHLPPLVRLPFRFGQEAVILFFLLSGFVIYLSAIRSSDKNFKRYFLKRFVRIYPILLATLLLSIIVALINQSTLSNNDFITLIGNFLMLQDEVNKPGYIVLPFLENHPLWSLCYEWWFYMMFYPLFFHLIRQPFIKINSIYVILLISASAWFAYLWYPNHMFLVVSYFILWWSGVACADIYIKYKTFTLLNLKPVLISLFIMSCLTAIPIITFYKNHMRLTQIMYPVVVFRHFAFAVLIILAGLAWWKFKLAKFDSLFGWFAKLSPLSYAIYLTHFVFINLKLTTVNPYIAIAVKLLLTFACAYLLEIKMQPVVTSWFFKKKQKPSVITYEVS